MRRPEAGRRWVWLGNHPKWFRSGSEVGRCESRYRGCCALIDTNVFSNGSWYTLLRMAYTKPDIVNRPTFAPPLIILQYAKTRNVGNLTDEFEAGSLVQSRGLLATMTQKSDAAFMETFPSSRTPPRFHRLGAQSLVRYRLLAILADHHGARHA